MRALLTGATHGIGEATAASPLSGRRRPRASRAEPEERVEPSLYELRERNPSTDIVYLPPTTVGSPTSRTSPRRSERDSVASSC